MKREYVALFGAISTSEKLADLRDDAPRLFYTWLLAQCDVWGRITAKPRTLNAVVWPMLERTVEQTQAAVDACVAVNLLELHELDGDRWLQVPKEDWESKAGRLTPPNRRGRSEFPEGTDATRICAGAPGAERPSREHSGVLRSSPANSGALASTPLRREEKREETPLPPASGGRDPSAPPADPEPERPRTRRRPPRDRSPVVDPATCTLPLALDRPAVREALAAWCARCEDDGRRPLRQLGLELLMRSLEPHGAETAAAALQRAAEAGFPRVEVRGVRARPPPKAPLSRPDTPLWKQLGYESEREWRDAGARARQPRPKLLELMRAQQRDGATTNGDPQSNGSLQTSNGALATSAGGGA